MLRGRSSGSSLLVAVVRSWGSIPPSTMDAYERRGTKRMQESSGEVSESTSSGCITKRSHIRNKLPKDKQRITEAHDHYRWWVLMWFENHCWEHLESKYLNNSQKNMDIVKEELKLVLLEAMNGVKFAEDRRKSNYKDWIENQVREAIYNSIVAYMQVYGVGAGSSDGTKIGKSELLQKLEKWCNGIAIIKPKGRTVILGFIEKDLAAEIVTESCPGVVWLFQNAMIILQDSNVIEGMFGKVRKVTIKGAMSIPEWIEFAGKTMKVDKNLNNRKERPTPALACPVDHLGMIKLLYLNTRRYESYSMWWNGGSLMNMLAYDKTIMDTHESEILQSPGFHYEAWQKLVVYRKNQAYLAWALMCIVDVVHKQDVLHNDLNPNNVMLQFSRDRGGAVFIGICDWGMATWIQEEALSNYGKKNKKDLRKHRAKYYCAASKLFHVIGERRTSQSPMWMARAHKHLIIPSPIRWECWQGRSTRWMQLQPYSNKIGMLIA